MSGRDFDDASAKANEKAEQARSVANEKAGQAKQVANEKAEQAKAAAKDAKTGFIKTLEDDGVVDPKGLSMFAFGGLFLAFVPVTSWLAQPNGLVEKLVNTTISTVGLVTSAGSTSVVPQSGKIAALGALYITVTYALTGAGSAAGAASGTKGGRDNNHPRAQTSQLRGLPLRLHSAHYNLMEMFPGWAVAAALTQAMAPGDQSLINLLGLHVISKCFVYYPSYVFNIGTPRTFAHVFATSAIINVALRLAKRPIT